VLCPHKTCLPVRSTLFQRTFLRGSDQFSVRVFCVAETSLLVATHRCLRCVALLMLAAMLITEDVIAAVAAVFQRVELT
jgi:hypothetical protein